MQRHVPTYRPLATYFADTRSNTFSSPLGRDPMASRVPAGSVLSRLILLRCDVGMASEAALDAGDAAEIREYWKTTSPGKSGTVTSPGPGQLPSGPCAKATTRQAHRRFNAMAREAKGDTMRLTSRLEGIRRRESYQRALSKLDVELQARDPYARAVMGEAADVAP